LQNRRSSLISQINVVPFVDVMLVLLVIFMITAPMMSKGVDVDLPRTKTVHTLPQESERLVLSVQKDRTIHLDEYEVKIGELEKYLQKVLKDKQDDFVYLRADHEVTHGFVVKVMSAVRSAGIRRMGVVAKQETAD